MDQRDPQTYAIIGAAMHVHRELGHGFLEPVYQQSMAIELTHRGIPMQREVVFTITYRDQALDCPYRSDFVCHDAVILELKAVEKLTDRHRSQVINYLKASGLKRALLINFGAPKLEYERIVLDYA